MKKWLFLLLTLPACAQVQIGRNVKIGGGGSDGGVTSINGTPGDFTFTGSGVNCVTTTCTFSGSGSGIGSITWAIPSWLTASPTTISATGTQTFSPTTAQTSHKVIGTCGAATTFGPCSLVIADLPSIAFSNLTGSLGTTQGPALTGLLKDAAGTLSAATAGTDYLTPTGSSAGLSQATTGAFGVVKPDGTSITISAGVISAVSGGSGTVTHTAGALTLHDCVVGNGAADIAVDPSCSTDGSGNLTVASLTASGTTPGSASLAAGTGSIPTLPANSGGFAAPVTGGTAYLAKLPATITAGIAHFGTPGTVDGVNESALTSSLVSLPADVTGLLPHANIASTAVTPGSYTAANITVAADGSITAASNGSGGGGNTTSTSLTSNIMPKANGANSIINSSVTDNGTTVTTTDTGGYVGPSVTTNGTTAGYYVSAQGTTSSGTGQCGVLANSRCVQEATSLASAFVETRVAPTTGLTLQTVSGAVITDSIVAPSVTVNGTLCTLGSSCSPSGSGVTLQTNTVNNTSQITLNLINSSTNSAGLTLTETNTSGGIVQGEIAGTANIAHGGTGTGSTLTGLVRGSSSAMTAAEISGDCTTSGSNAITCTKTSGTALTGYATATFVANTTTTIAGSVAFTANTCSSIAGTANTASTLSMTGLATSMTLNFTPTSDVKAVTGWSPGTGGQLYFQSWPSSSGTASYYICNATGSTITTGGSTTWNVSAR